MNQKKKKTKTRSKTYKKTTKKYKYPKDLKINFKKDKQNKVHNKSYIPKSTFKNRDVSPKKRRKKFKHK